MKKQKIIGSRISKLLFSYGQLEEKESLTKTIELLHMKIDGSTKEEISKYICRTSSITHKNLQKLQNKSIIVKKFNKKYYLQQHFRNRLNKVIK